MGLYEEQSLSEGAGGQIGPVVLVNMGAQNHLLSVRASACKKYL